MRDMTNNGTHPADGDRSYEWCLEQAIPPRDLTLDDLAVIRSVGAMCTWGGKYWRWDGHDWQHAG